LLSETPYEPVQIYAQDKLVQHLRGVVRLGVEWEGESVRSDREGEVIPLKATSPDPKCALKSYRYHQFDTGGSLGIYAEDDGDEGKPNAFSLLQNALSRWNAVPASSINVYYQGTKNFDLTSGGCRAGGRDDDDTIWGPDTPPDGQNIVIWDDPCWDMDSPNIDPPNPVSGHDTNDGCSGTLAFGGSWYSSNTHSYDGQSWNNAISWYAVMDNGTSACSDSIYEQVLTHEFGHGLGFGHHEYPFALMYGSCCNEMGILDEACAQYLYSDGSCPPFASPTNLDAETPGPSQVDLGWDIGIVDPSAIEIHRATDSGPFTYLTVKSGTTTNHSDLNVLQGKTYHYRVRAASSCQNSSWSSTASVTLPPNTGTAPKPDFRWSPSVVRIGQKVSFAGSATPTPSSWLWTFGDGESGSGQQVSHTYAAAGTFSVKLVAAAGGLSGEVTKTVTALEPPDPIVAASAHKTGKNGTFWSTNMAMVNPGFSRTSGTIRFVNGSGPTTSSLRFSIKPRYMVTEQDIVGEMGVTATGGLLIELDPGSAAPSVMSRTFTPGQVGTYGHATPGQEPFSTGTYYLTGVRGGPDFRSNFGIAVSKDGPASAKLTLRLPSSTLQGPTLQMVAGSMAQWGIEDIWGSPVLSGVDSATLEVTLTGDAVIYLAVIDEKSGDPVYITGTKPSETWQIPLIGRTPGKLGTFWDTDIVLYNPNSSSATVELEWLAADLDNRTGTPKKQILLAARETRLVQNAPKTLWSIDQGNGSVMIVATRSIAVEARTWTPVPNSLPGTMGQRIIPIDLSGVRRIPSSLPWVREDDDVRTNVGFINRSNGLKTLSLRLYRSTGTVSRTGEILLAPRSVSQRSLEFLFGTNALGQGKSGWVEITNGATSDTEIFASQVTNDSGDPIFVPGG
ncbi:MAG: PKD domain-containing protein, partial [bacterium]|nr:PKD domain-containing protein [bacterium]